MTDFYKTLLALPEFFSLRCWPDLKFSCNHNVEKYFTILCFTIFLHFSLFYKSQKQGDLQPLNEIQNQLDEPE